MNLIHTIFEPAGDGPHPTVIALHGWGANAMDLLGLAPHLNQGRWLVLAPQGPVEIPIGPGMVGYGWFPLTLGQPPDMAALEAGVEALQSFIDGCVQRYPIDREKTVLLGFSQGGVMAFSLALRERDRFAAVAGLSTWLPELVVQRHAQASLDGLPVLVQHGTRDELIDVERGRENVERLRALRAAVTYREYEMGHEISPDSLRDLLRFLEEKVLSPVVLA